MTYPNQLSSPAQAAWPDVVNENVEAIAHAAVYAYNYATSTGLTWGYFGGRWGGNAVADGTLSLTNAADNYVVANRSTGAISVSTANTNWNATTTYARVYKLTTAGSVVTATEDHRAGLYGVHGIAVSPGAVGDFVGPASSTDSHFVQFDGTTGKLGKGGVSIDTDATLAANSNTRIATQAAVKAYADALVAGLSWKQAVRAATTAALTLASNFENGDTIDGVTLATGNRILIKNQASASENGIYVVAASGAPARATDADSGAELVNASVYVSEGTTLADTQWTCTTNATITVGATSLAFAQLSSGSGVSDGDKGDITVSGSGAIFTIDNTVVTLAKIANASASSKLLGSGASGSGSSYAELTLGTNLSMSGTTLNATGGSGTKTYAILTPMTSQPPASNYATLDTRNSIAVLDFDASTDEAATWVWIVPEAASLGSGLKIEIHWMATSATSGTTRWGVQIERMTTDLDSDSFDTAQTGGGSANGTSGILTVTELTITTIDSIAAGDAFRLKVYRDADGTSGTDDMTGDAELVAVEIRSGA